MEKESRGRRSARPSFFFRGRFRTPPWGLKKRKSPCGLLSYAAWLHRSASAVRFRDPGSATPGESDSPPPEPRCRPDPIELDPAELRQSGRPRIAMAWFSSMREHGKARHPQGREGRNQDAFLKVGKPALRPVEAAIEEMPALPAQD